MPATLRYNPPQLILLSLLAALPSLADDALPEIVVVGDLRQTTELETITSVTVVGIEDVAAKNATHLEEALSYLPNVNYAAGTARARFFQIRGIGERSQFASPQNPSVGVLIDGIDLSGAADIAGLLDLDQLEVLRGPQGTRYGANALAGLVYIKSADPTPNAHARFKLGAGSYGAKTASGVFNWPLNQGTAIRIALEQQQSDGYYTNDFLSRDDTNARDEQSVIAKVRHELAQGRIDWVTRFSDFDNGYDAFSLDNTRQTLSDEPGRDAHRMVAHGVTWHQTLGAHQLEMHIDRVRSDLSYGYDEDWAFPDIHPYSYSSTDQYDRDRVRSSVMVKWSNTAPAESALSWLFGAQAANQRVELTRLYTWLDAPYQSDYGYKTRSLFGEVSRPLPGRLTLLLGARLEQRRQSFLDSNEVQFTPDDTLGSGRVALQWSISDQAMTYVSLSRGVKSGGFNTDGSLPEGLRSFNPESLLEIEVGIRAALLDDRMQLKGAVFRSDRRNQQIKSSRVTQRADGSTEFVDYLGNAAEGTNQGLELEGRFLLSDHWRGRFALGLLDTEFQDFVNEFGEDFSGRDQAQAPHYTAQGHLMYEEEWLTFQVGFELKDDFYFSDRHNAKSRQYALLNVNTTFHMGAFDLSLWGRNLTDQTIYTRGFGSFGNDPRKDYVTESYFQFGEPRVWGITLSGRLNDD